MRGEITCYLHVFGIQQVDEERVGGGDFPGRPAVCLERERHNGRLCRNGGDGGGGETCRFAVLIGCGNDGDTCGVMPERLLKELGGVYSSVSDLGHSRFFLCGCTRFNLPLG